MRNALVHGCDRIDDAVVYRTATRDLALLPRPDPRELEALGGGV